METSTTERRLLAILVADVDWPGIDQVVIVVAPLKADIVEA